MRPKNKFSAILAQTAYQSLNPEPSLIFISKTSSYPQSKFEFNKIIKPYKISLSWGLGSESKLWAIWAQIVYQLVNLKPPLSLNGVSGLVG